MTKSISSTPKAKKYSGKISLRLSPEMHEYLSSLANLRGLSLNQLINDTMIKETGFKDESTSSKANQKKKTFSPNKLADSNSNKAGTDFDAMKAIHIDPDFIQSLLAGKKMGNQYKLENGKFSKVVPPDPNQSTDHLLI